ncbi:flagellar motor switch protein [Neoasaia chiangmaiensis NBRC 101099]|uniref:flagellar motor switch protein FliN n=1 Tax=Neoasaia chiangmaiensis TaxID=320497 RepID=UPI00098AF09C|nr:flagellar motor switch protein FliN [Neoasaia chiangmaiensis]GBR40362.1 flagellar motor switch protein [Neoasaia chiangmaiensis NBRC 101099]GEN13935.1 hypothetical protein NCH01_03660 [Neoasaia chiangmaiensis]
MNKENEALDVFDKDAVAVNNLTSPEHSRNFDVLYDIPVSVSALLGRATMQISQVLKLGKGDIVELDKKIGDPIDILVNNKFLARGEVVVIDEKKIGIIMTEVSKRN